MTAQRPTCSRKRKSVASEDGFTDESDSETSSFRSRGKGQRRDKSPDAISIHAGESQDEVAKLLGCSEAEAVSKEHENEPARISRDILWGNVH